MIQGFDRMWWCWGANFPSCTRRSPIFSVRYSSASRKSGSQVATGRRCMPAERYRSSCSCARFLTVATRRRRKWTNLILQVSIQNALAPALSNIRRIQFRRGLFSIRIRQNYFADELAMLWPPIYQKSLKLNLGKHSVHL